MMRVGDWPVFKAGWWKRQLGGGRLIALVLTALLVWVRIIDPSALETARAKTFDLYQQWKPRPVPAAPPVVIIDIDDASLEAYGQWPWPRTILAKLVDNLTAAGVAAIGFDAVFAEPDRMSPDRIAQSVAGVDQATANKLAALPSNDEIFARSIANSRVVVGMAGQEGAGTQRRMVAPPSVPTWGRFGNESPVPWLMVPGSHFSAVLRNVPPVDHASRGWGIFTVTPETDGVVRRVPVVLTDGTDLFPALSTELLRLGTSSESFGISTREDGVQFVKLGRNRINTDGHGRVWIYARPHDQSLYLRAKYVLDGSADPAAIAGKLAIVGTSAVALGDIRATATDRQIPGVEVHAQIIESILFGEQLVNPPSAVGVEILAAVVSALLMIVLVPLIGARWTLILFLSLSGALAYGSWHEFAQDHTLYDPIFPVVVTLLAYIVTTYASFSREEAQRKQVRGAFSRYMSPALVERLAADPTLLKLGGETRDMTLLFADIRGFTTISESFGADAQGLTKLINRFLTPMTDVILARKGTIDKYMGDCIMAFWNAPLDDADHAANACRSALAMKQDLQPLNGRLEDQAKAEGRRHVPINIGIGLNSGDVVVGNMGSDQRFDYSVLGDTVNLASRLEGQSKTYGVTVVIGEATHDKAPGFASLELDLIKVKGKTEAVRIFTLLGDEELAGNPAFQALAEQHKAMLAAYRAQDWAKARELVAACTEAEAALGLGIAKFYHLYEERIAEYEQSPPGADWDGVFVATSK